jgi:4,5-dihydroxyphthalate decarboxylase
MEKISIGGFLYLDRSQPLVAGSVQVDGLDYAFTILSAVELGRRVYQGKEFDAGELWAASYICDVARQRSEYVGLPVFPSRVFRHGFIYVREDSGIQVPADLAGKRVGVVEYVQTAAVWIRAFLEHDYGVSPSDIEWVLTRQQTHAPIAPPAHLSVTMAADERSVEQMLHAGEIDAAIGALNPRSMLAGPVRRLFGEPRTVETEYYRRTGLFPIMHILGVRRDLYEREPEIARALFRLFCEAKKYGDERLRRTSSLAVSLPWLEDHLQETRAIFDRDPFAYGFAANRDAVDALTRYVLEQGLAPRKVEPEELFAAETLDT